MTRLGRHKAGARLILHKDDLLHAVIMPPSVSVRTVKVLVSRSGNLECAEWITGSESKFSHREKQLDSKTLSRLTQCLTRLGQAEQDIAFGEIECDYAEYEDVERIFLRFWFNGKEQGAFLPNQQFYNDFDVISEKRMRFENAFRAVVSGLGKQEETKETKGSGLIDREID